MKNEDKLLKLKREIIRKYLIYSGYLIYIEFYDEKINGINHIKMGIDGQKRLFVKFDNSSKIVKKEITNELINTHFKEEHLTYYKNRILAHEDNGEDLSI